MTILHLVTNADLGGAPRVVIELANRAAADGHRVAVASMPQGPLWEALDSRIEPYPLVHLRREINPLADWRCLIELRQLIKQLQPDIVHLHSSKMGVLGRLAAGRLAAGQCGPVQIGVKSHNSGLKASNQPWRTVYTIHGFDTILKKHRYFLPLERFLAPWTSAIAAVSAYDLKNAQTAGLKTRLELIPNGVTDRRGLACTNSEALDRLNASREAGHTLILSTARLAPPKRFDLFLDVARHFADQPKPKRPVAFFWIGNANAATPTVLPPNVTMLGELSEAGNYAKLCDIFLLLSDYEGMPMSILEALSCGKPVIASKVGGIPEVFGHPQANADMTSPLFTAAGALVNNEKTCIAQAIQHFIIHDEVYSNACLAARALYESNFSAESMWRAYEALYCRVLKL